MFSIIAWVVIGGLAGWLASIIMKTNAQMGFVANVAAGVVGALVGGWLVGLLFDIEVDPNGFSIPSLLTAVLGAVIVIWVVKVFMGRK